MNQPIDHSSDTGNLDAKPAVHIGFLDYTLFEGQPEFYASYKLINVKNHQKYSDILTLHVVDLSRIDLATEEDRKYHIHEWALLFKSTTWEEIKMLASKDEYLQEASETMFRMSADDLVRKRCRDREEYYQDLRNYERKIEQDRLEHEQDIRNYKQKIEQDRLEHEQDIRNYEQQIEQNRLAHEKDIRGYEQQIEQNRLEHEQAIAEKDALIRQLLAENEALKKREM